MAVFALLLSHPKLATILTSSFFWTPQNLKQAWKNDYFPEDTAALTHWLPSVLMYCTMSSKKVCPTFQHLLAQQNLEKRLFLHHKLLISQLSPVNTEKNAPARPIFTVITKYCIKNTITLQPCSFNWYHTIPNPSYPKRLTEHKRI